MPFYMVDQYQLSNNLKLFDFPVVYKTGWYAKCSVYANMEIWDNLFELKTVQEIRKFKKFNILFNYQ